MFETGCEGQGDVLRVLACLLGPTSHLARRITSHVTPRQYSWTPEEDVRLRQIVQELQASYGTADKGASDRSLLASYGTADEGASDRSLLAAVTAIAASASSPAAPAAPASPARPISNLKSSFSWQLVAQKLGGQFATRIPHHTSHIQITLLTFHVTHYTYVTTLTSRSSPQPLHRAPNRSSRQRPLVVPVSNGGKERV